MTIDRATQVKTEVILFNIGSVSQPTVDDQALTRAFVRTFYEHFGYYGEDPRVAKLEKYVDTRGKAEEFRRLFEARTKSSWKLERETISVHKTLIAELLNELFGLDKEDALAWINEESKSNISVSSFVDEVKDYVERQPEDFRLLFMVDEVGQYAGKDTQKLLRLRTLSRISDESVPEKSGLSARVRRQSRRSSKTLRSARKSYREFRRDSPPGCPSPPPPSTK
ncbi:MAG: hypothetical protein ACOX0A_07190 [Thermoguttaceae bacterium]